MEAAQELGKKSADLAGKPGDHSLGFGSRINSPEKSDARSQSSGPVVARWRGQTAGGIGFRVSLGTVTESPGQFRTWLLVIGELVMIVGVPRESYPGERRVALVPAVIPGLLKAGLEVVVEAGAGTEAGYPDADYAAEAPRSSGNAPRSSQPPTSSSRCSVTARTTGPARTTCRSCVPSRC